MKVAINMGASFIFTASKKEIAMGIFAILSYF